MKYPRSSVFGMDEARHFIISDTAIILLKRDDKLQPTARHFKFGVQISHSEYCPKKECPKGIF